MRKCPECDVPLKETEMRGEIIDRCPQCNGIYFDKGELESIIKIIDYYQKIRLPEQEIDCVSDEERGRELKCPHDGEIMNKELVGEVVMDVCPSCKGIWLDNGEISALKVIENHVHANLNLYIRLGE